MLINRGRGAGWKKAAHPMYKTTSWWSCEGWFTLTHNSYVQDIKGCFRLQTVCKSQLPTTNSWSNFKRLGKFAAIFPISKILLSLLNDDKSHLSNSQPEQESLFCLSLSSSYMQNFQTSLVHPLSTIKPPNHKDELPTSFWDLYATSSSLGF
jgi:hypothetical protein